MVTYGTCVQLPKNIQSYLDIAPYCCYSSFGSVPIKHGNQPLYCHFLPESTTHGIVCDQGILKLGNIECFYITKLSCFSLPPCFIYFLIPRFHLHFFFLAEQFSSPALLCSGTTFALPKIIYSLSN